MNKKFVYQVGNNKKSYTTMHGQPNINSLIIDYDGLTLCDGVVSTELWWMSDYVTCRLVTLAKVYS
jgi:hypothetical protein